MTTQVIKEADVLREVAQILLTHLSPAKTARFLANWQTGQGDYLIWRDEVFGNTSVDALYAQIVEFQRQMEVTGSPVQATPKSPSPHPPVE